MRSSQGLSSNVSDTNDGAIPAIVIVNYCTPALTIDCLRSLVDSQESATPWRVVLVDNASPDGSATFLANALQERVWDDWVTLIVAPRNGGFAYGNNIGIGHALRAFPNVEFIWLLNPDTLVHPGSLSALVQCLRDNPKVGIVGSRLENLNEVPQHSAFRFPNLIDELDRGLQLGIATRLFRKYIVAQPIQSYAHATDWVSGASFMIRRQVFEDIGLLDEGYFMYYEEVDFCKRAKQAGWESWYVPTSRVIHLEGQASGIRRSGTKPKRRPSYLFESRRRFFQKHFGRFYAILADLLWLFAYPLWRIRRWIQRKPDRDPQWMWRDMFRHSSILHGIDRKPRNII